MTQKLHINRNGVNLCGHKGYNIDVNNSYLLLDCGQFCGDCLKQRDAHQFTASDHCDKCGAEEYEADYFKACQNTF